MSRILYNRPPPNQRALRGDAIRLGRSDEATRAWRPMRAGIPGREHGGMTTTVTPPTAKRRPEWLVPAGPDRAQPRADRGRCIARDPAGRRRRGHAPRTRGSSTRPSRSSCTSSARASSSCSARCSSRRRCGAAAGTGSPGRIVAPAGLLSALVRAVDDPVLRHARRPSPGPRFRDPARAGHRDGRGHRRRRSSRSGEAMSRPTAPG